jgi:hypothetical protein
VDSTALASGLFVLAAFFVRAAVTAVTTLMIHILDALLIAGRLIALRITTRRLMSAALLTLVHITLRSLHLISVVWHIYSSSSVS